MCCQITLGLQRKKVKYMEGDLGDHRRPLLPEKSEQQSITLFYVRHDCCDGSVWWWALLGGG